MISDKTIHFINGVQVSDQQYSVWVEQNSYEKGYRAGTKEVVEFVVGEIFPLLDMASVPVSFKDRWNAKLQDWNNLRR